MVREGGRRIGGVSDRGRRGGGAGMMKNGREKNRVKGEMVGGKENRRGEK